MVGHDDNKNKYNGVEYPLYPAPQPHKKIVYTNRDIADITDKLPRRLDSDLDEPPRNRIGKR